LTDAGFEVDIANDALSGLALAARHTYDLALIDWRLPGRMDGLALARQLRVESPSMGLLMLTVVRAGEHRRRALEEACDDYLMKPCEMTDLVVRLRAVARRAMRSSESRVVSWGPIRVDLGSCVAEVDGAPLNGLQPAQVRLLALLIRRAGHVCRHDDIRKQVYHVGAHHRTSIARAVSVLRRSLGPLGDQIRTVTGGYGIGIQGHIPRRIHRSHPSMSNLARDVLPNKRSELRAISEERRSRLGRGPSQRS
jgi:two-component system OmpR family response regulator